MFLKRFDIQGFKSFADKTTLEFGDGISTIVGPNGSGKSNISDALLWVMGEQKMKSLRGSKTEDIIFSGSETHKPLGLAQVSICLDNAQGILPLPYEEVTVTRKAFRSGEGEFSINKTPCRLKDIQDLFNDTGIGKDSFAMIGQGKVNEIISAKPEDRRAMIEELAGIVKYRNRKKEALRKIENTETNLTRVMDIISELDVNMEPLEAEAERARLYLEIKEELDDLDINLLVRDIESGQVRREELESGRNRGEEQAAGLESQIATEEATFEEERMSLETLREAMGASQNRLYEMKNQMQSLTGQMDLSESMLARIGERKEVVLTDIQEQQQRIDQLEAENREKVQSHQELLARLGQNEQEIHRAQKAQEFLRESIRESQEKLDEVNGEIVDNLGHLSQLKNELQRVALEKDGLLSREGKTLERTGELSRSLEDMETQRQKLQEDIDTRGNGLTALREQLTALQGQQAAVKESLDKKRSRLVERERSLQTLQSKQKALEEIRAEYQGYYGGVKSILKARETNSQLAGIHGVVADLIEMDKVHSLAIDTALGSAVQDVVADTRETAKQAIGYLKQNQKGRATFLPLDVIQSRSLRKSHEDVLKLDGVLGTADGLVRCDERFRPAIANLLGHVLVTRDLNAAGKASTFCDRNVRIVTLEGDVIHPGGSMTGGAQKGRSSNLLARNVEWKDLKERIHREAAVLEEENRAFAREAEQTETFRQQTTQLQERLSAEETHLRDRQTAMEYLRRDLDNLKSSLEVVQLDQGEMDAEKRRLDDLEGRLREELETVSTENDRLNALYSEIKERIQAGQDSLSQKMEETSQARVEDASLREKEQSVQGQLADYYRQREELGIRLTRLEEERDKLLTDETEHNDTVETINSRVETLAQSIEDLRFSLQDDEQKKDRLSDSINSKAVRSRELRKALSVVQKELKETSVALARQETDLENKFRRLEERHELTLEEALGHKREIDDLEAAEKRLKELKKEMAFLGTVNIAAIDEYNRLRERFDFLSKQEGDLRESIDKLGAVVQEIDQVMIARFRESFGKISDAFRETFTELFGGGDARIFLTDPQDYLNTGVDIEARPPGKGLKNMSLLSGGEKALTAIALLFAFLTIKPSPFCVLDEIDAALDELNVTHFAGFLRKFARHTQFIVITHRQGTIEHSDCLYGVTMDKTSGVTKMVSVRLEDSQQQGA